MGLVRKHSVITHTHHVGRFCFTVGCGGGGASVPALLPAVRVPAPVHAVPVVPQRLLPHRFCASGRHSAGCLHSRHLRNRQQPGGERHPFSQHGKRVHRGGNC